jgi:putative holliday junction resolvase
MALDVGAKRIGVAVADPAGKLALPVATIVRTSVHDDLARIAEYLESYGVTTLVVGDPISLRGERGIAAQRIDEFVELLGRVFAGPIQRVDERMTTAQATKSLIAADVSRRKRREVVDQMAAALILESFLARRGGSTP